MFCCVQVRTHACDVQHCSLLLMVKMNITISRAVAMVKNMQSSTELPFGIHVWALKQEGGEYQDIARNVHKLAHVGIDLEPCRCESMCNAA